jgi:hypothetical protein
MSKILLSNGAQIASDFVGDSPAPLGVVCGRRLRRCRFDERPARNFNRNGMYRQISVPKSENDFGLPCNFAEEAESSCS